MAKKKLVVVKRDGSVQTFTDTKIINALKKAGLQDEFVSSVVQDVIAVISSLSAITVEDIQDKVETSLMTLGHNDVAKKYILYRDNRRKARELRGSPDPGALSAYTDASKYARFLEDKSRRETWIETTHRRKGMDLKRWPEHKDLIEEAFSLVEQKKILPSMRSMQFGGEAAEKMNARMYNCLGSETTFITKDGVRSFRDFEDGDETIVLTHKGNWKRAIVRNYGKSKLSTIKFTKGRGSYTVRATSDHRWILNDGSVTEQLKFEDKIANPPIPFESWNYDEATPTERLYWCYGYVYGDGTKVKDSGGNYRYSMVRLCGDDGKYLSRFEEMGFDSSSPLSCNGDKIVYTGTYLKTAPDISKDGPDLVRAFVKGYLDADGAKNTGESNRSSFRTIQSSEKDHIDFIRSVFPCVGVYILSEEELTGQVTNLGIRPYTIRFSLLTYFGTNGTSRFSVGDIVQSQKLEDVWCLEVEDDHSFVLQCGIVTGNCSFSLVDRPRFFAEMFYLLLAGCGCGYSVQYQHVDKLPKIKPVDRKSVYFYSIEDSIQGWADAIDVLMSSYLRDSEESHPYVEFDYSQIRVAGSPLKTSGGRAPGHVPLKTLLEEVRTVLDNAVGRKLKPIECHDINCFIAKGVLSGGIRRSSLIALFSPEDSEMMNCKTGNWFETNLQRRMANNSAVLLRGNHAQNYNSFSSIFTACKEYGDPAFYFSVDPNYGCNPCGEIGLNPIDHQTGRTGWAFCNLTEINAAACKTKEDFYLACRMAARIGTFQAAYNDFPYLGEVTERIVKREALLGVSITGILDNPITMDPKVLKKGARIAVAENAHIAKLLHINPAARVTTVKPSGTASLSLGGVGSGHHPHHARRYIRRVTANDSEPVFNFFRQKNPHMCVRSVYEKLDWVIEFPVEAPDNAIVKDDLTAPEFIKLVFNTYENWIKPGTADIMSSPGLTHNVSCTVVVGEDEWEEVKNLVWDNRNRISAMTFLSKSGDKVYPQAPMEAVKTASDEARWNELIANYVPVDYTQLLEDTDDTSHRFVGACEGPKCEVVNTVGV